MKKISCFYRLSVFLFVLILIGCSENNRDTPETPPVINFSDETDVRPTFGTEGGFINVSFTTTDKWNAQVNGGEDWIIVFPTQGEAGNTSIQINVQQNSTYDKRNASVILYCGNIEKIITITQQQKDAILSNQNEYIVNAEGGLLEFPVNVNVDFDIIISEDWIHQNTTRGLTEKILSFTIDENTTSTSRQGTISLVGENLQQDILIEQNKVYNGIPGGSADDIISNEWQ